MAKVLYIVANPRRMEESYSQRVGRAFLRAYHWYRPSDQILYLDLYKMNIPYLDQRVFAAWEKLLQDQVLTEEEINLVDYIDSIVEQFVRVDKYVIVCPMWNALFPAKLNAYLDIVCFAGRKYENYYTGETDVLAGKKALFIQARGGEYKSPEMQGLDFATPYIRTTFHSLGLIDFKYLHIEGTMSKPEMASIIEKNAVQEARELAAWFADQDGERGEGLKTGPYR